MPMVFFKTGWMSRHQGLKGDPIFSTMSYVVENKYGHERNSFKPKRGKCFGYAPVAGVNIHDAFEAELDAKYTDGIDVVWVSNRPKPLGGLVIVGWYRNARVYRHKQASPGLIIAEAIAANCKLLRVAERSYGLPLSGPGSFRSTKVWYARHHPRIIRDVQSMIAGTYHVKPGKVRQTGIDDPDLTRRAEVETAAIDRVTEHYVSLGFNVESVEKLNRGWDLEATGRNKKLLLEVKGTSHGSIQPLLTPNEFDAANANRSSFHLCIVSDALEIRPVLTDLHYASNVDGWISDDAEIWDIVSVTSGLAKPRENRRR